MRKKIFYLHKPALVRDVARWLTTWDVPIGQNKLFQFLRDSGFLHKAGSSYNLPTQKALDEGFFCIRSSTRRGSNIPTETPLVTVAGQQMLLQALRG